MATKDEYSRFPVIPKNIVDGTTSYYNLAQQAYKAGQADAQSAIAGEPQPAALQTVDVTAENRPVSDYQYNQNLINSILKAPMTQEQEEKRARSAYAIGGIGALGKAFSAFSNLVFTGRGAPSQTLPTAPDTYGLVKDMQDRNQKDRENYLRYKTAARSADRSEWAQDQNVFLQQKGYNDNIKKYNSETAYTKYWKGKEYADSMGARAEARAGKAYDAAATEKRHQETLAESRANRAQSASQFRETMNETKAAREQRLIEFGFKNPSNNTSTLNVLVDDGNGNVTWTPMTFDFSSMTEQTLAGLYARIPKNVKHEVGYLLEEAKGDPKKSNELKTQAVIEAITSSTDATYFNDVKPLLEKDGIIGPRAGKKGSSQAPVVAPGFTPPITLVPGFNLPK